MFVNLTPPSIQSPISPVSMGANQEILISSVNELPQVIPEKLTKLFNAKPSTFDLFFVKDELGREFVIKGLRNIKENGQEKGEKKRNALIHEAHTYAALQSLGASVPKTTLIRQETNVILNFGSEETVELFPEVLVMEYLPAQELVSFVQENKKDLAALKNLSAEFNSQFINILLAGLYDVPGMRYDNVLMTTEGKLILIDMTASFDKMYDGSPKATSFVAGNWKRETPQFFGVELNPAEYMTDPRFVMCDFTKLFDPKFSQTSMLLRSLTWEEIKKQVIDFDPSKVIEAANQGRFPEEFANFLIARGNYLKNNLDLLDKIWNEKISPKIASVKSLHEQDWTSIPKGTSYVPMQAYHFGLTETSFAPKGTPSEKPQEPAFDSELAKLPNLGYLVIVKEPGTDNIYLTTEGMIPFAPAKSGEEVKIIFKGLMAAQSALWDGKLVPADDAIFDVKLADDKAVRFSTYNPISGGPRPSLQLVSKDDAIRILEANGHILQANLIKEAFGMGEKQESHFVNVHPVRMQEKKS